MHDLWLKSKIQINADLFSNADLGRPFKLMLFKSDANSAENTVMVKNSLGIKTHLDTDLNG